jgi:hypothetical protein
MFRQNYTKGSAIIRLAGCVNKALVLIDYFFTDGQPDARTGVFGFPMQPLEYLEDPFIVFRFKPNTIIGKIDPEPVTAFIEVVVFFLAAR